MSLSDFVSTTACGGSRPPSQGCGQTAGGGSDRVLASVSYTLGAAAQVENMGGEIARLRPRLVVATFRQWTNRELDLRQEAASASAARSSVTSS